MSKNATTIVIAILLAILIILGINAMNKQHVAGDGTAVEQVQGETDDTAAPAADAPAATTPATETPAPEQK